MRAPGTVAATRARLRLRLRARAQLFALLLWPAIACRENQTGISQPPANQPRQETAVLASRELGYPKGQFHQHDLNSLLLSASQIVVAHRDAKPGTQLPAPVHRDRDRAQALALAFELQNRLQRDPADFEVIAARESDEPVTGAMGGALGIFAAYSVPEALLNALGQMRVGEISRVLETEQGFHVLERTAVPADGSIALSHIAIKYTGCSGWRRLDRPVPARTRDEARALAGQIASEARGADARTFAELARRRSESDDSLRGGDMGVYTRHENMDSEYLLREAGFRLPVGGTSGVLETPAGFHVLRREAVRERPVLAASAILIGYGDSQLERVRVVTGRARDHAARIAAQVIAKLERGPSAFPERRTESCDAIYCDGPLAWRTGRGLPELEAATSALAIGAITDHPIDTPLGFVVIKREDPADVALPTPLPATFEFPPAAQARLPL